MGFHDDEPITREDLLEDWNRTMSRPLSRDKWIIMEKRPGWRFYHSAVRDSGVPLGFRNQHNAESEMAFLQRKYPDRCYKLRHVLD